MKAFEHRAIGDEATAGSAVDLAGGLDLGLDLGLGFRGEPFLLRHGDVIALSGDYFLADDLPRLAATPGGREEIVCALKTMALDEGRVDSRFDGWAVSAEVQRRVRDRFLVLAAGNADHFLSPWDDGDSNGDSARATYRRLHRVALDHACRLGRIGGDLRSAMAREAAAQHYLTDAFASGHVRTPIAAIRQFWCERYPHFWESLQHKVAADTATALREVARPLRLLSPSALYDRTLTAVQLRTTGYPPVSLGDLLGRVFHDWDNDHGLVLESGDLLMGDGHLDEGAGRRLAVAAVIAGNEDIEHAFRLGASGSELVGAPLYRAVRGAGGRDPEGHLPRPSPDNPTLNWRAGDIDELWRSPIAGMSGPTVGETVAEVLDPAGEVARRLRGLAEALADSIDAIPAPLRRWLGRKASQAYCDGFLANLTNNPRATVCEVAGRAGGWLTPTHR